MMILATALPIRPNPLIATFVAIHISFSNIEKCVPTCFGLLQTEQLLYWVTGSLSRIFAHPPNAGAAAAFPNHTRKF
jgi:hypothetical protein